MSPLIAPCFIGSRKPLLNYRNFKDYSQHAAFTIQPFVLLLNASDCAVREEKELGQKDVKSKSKRQDIRSFLGCCLTLSRWSPRTTPRMKTLPYPTLASWWQQWLRFQTKQSIPCRMWANELYRSLFNRFLLMHLFVFRLRMSSSRLRRCLVPREDRCSDREAASVDAPSGSRVSTESVNQISIDLADAYCSHCLTNCRSSLHLICLFLCLSIWVSI